MSLESIYKINKKVYDENGLICMKVKGVTYGGKNEKDC